MNEIPTPERRPVNPCFSSGPCAKRPGFTLDALNGALLGRNHRAIETKAKITEVIDRSRALLGMPDDWRLGVVPASDTGAVEIALWSLLGPRPVDILAFESFGAGWATDILRQLKLPKARVLAADYGDLPDLAATQAGILHWVAERSQASEIIFCPSYYTDDPILDRIFGERPANYLEDLGRMLDPSIAVFWTGERVCSRDYSVAHLARVTDRLRRKPFLWDNYPVNDGPRMSQHLHLRAFTGRPAAITGHISGHAINPALQPTLTLIPALTLADSYARGERYDDGEAFAHAASEVLGNELAGVVKEDLNMLQDVALDELGDRLPSLRERYARFDHPGAKEIMAWLDGKYRFTGEMM